MLPISRRIKDKVHQGGKRNSATLAMALRAQGTLAFKRVLPLFYNLLLLYNLKCVLPLLYDLLPLYNLKRVLPLLYNLDLGTFGLKLEPLSLQFC